MYWLAFCPKREDISQGPEGMAVQEPALSAGVGVPPVPASPLWGGKASRSSYSPCWTLWALLSPVASIHMLLIKGPASPSLLSKDLLDKADQRKMQVRT